MNLERYWRGKRVFLTGASSGLGWAVAEALAPFGVHLGLAARRTGELETLAARLKDSGSRFTVLACDVSDRASVEKAVAAFEKAAGGIDVAWINSGVGGDTSFEEWSWDHVENMIAVNFTGFLYTARACLERMVPAARAGKGPRPAIVAISSAAAMRGLAGRSIYSATKIAVQTSMESFAAEHPEMQFTTILPGFVDTPINQGVENRIWLLTPPKAARLMLTAAARGCAEYIYPRRMAFVFHLVRMIPNRIYRALGRFATPITRPPAASQGGR